MTWPTTRPLVVVGPTAAGKSSLAEELAQRHDAELISADALQVYRGLDIGTAKPDAETRARLHYHGLDLYAPTERCTAGRYGRWARRTLSSIEGHGRRAIVVGGSGFYVRATFEPLDRMPSADPRWRALLSRIAEQGGAGELHRWLRRLDPERARGIDPADRQRLLRAVEVVLRCGRPAAELSPAPDGTAPDPCITIGLRWPREQLTRRIEERVDRMLGRGWLREVRELREAGVAPEAHALQAIGYRELVRHLAGELTLGEAREAIVQATRRYAKRQMTWFRARTEIRWIDLPLPGGIERVVAAAEAIIAAGCVPPESRARAALDDPGFC